MGKSKKHKKILNKEPKPRTKWIINSNEEREMIVNYLEKIHFNLVETGKATNRTIFMLIILYVLTIIITSGFAKMGNEFHIFGLKMELQSWVFPYTGAWLIFLFFLRFKVLIMYQFKVKKIIRTTYEQLSLGCIEKYCDLGFLEYPDIYNLFTDEHYLNFGKFQKPYEIFILSLINGPPLFIELYVFFELTESMGGIWWLIATFLTFLVFYALFLSAQVKLVLSDIKNNL